MKEGRILVNQLETNIDIVVSDRKSIIARFFINEIYGDGSRLSMGIVRCPRQPAGTGTKQLISFAHTRCPATDFIATSGGKDVAGQGRKQIVANNGSL